MVSGIPGSRVGQPGGPDSPEHPGPACTRGSHMVTGPGSLGSHPGPKYTKLHVCVCGIRNYAHHELPHRQRNHKTNVCFPTHSGDNREQVMFASRLARLARRGRCQARQHENSSSAKLPRQSDRPDRTTKRTNQRLASATTVQHRPQHRSNRRRDTRSNCEPSRDPASQPIPKSGE